MPQDNPANSTAPLVDERTRVPMSVPRQKLDVPGIPGYHPHWHLEENIPAAIRAGYEFVTSDEISVNQALDTQDVGGDNRKSGNQSLDSRISIIGNKIGGDGRPEMQYLMKLREEWWLKDRKQIDEREAEKLSTIFRGESIMGSDKTGKSDQGLRYVDKDRSGIARALFNRPARKGKT